MLNYNTELVELMSILNKLIKQYNIYLNIDGSIINSLSFEPLSSL